MNIKRKFQSLQKDHIVEYKKCAGDNDLPDKLQVLFELHQKKWGSANVRSKFAHDNSDLFKLKRIEAKRNLSFFKANVSGTLDLLWIIKARLYCNHMD
jgi:hypothetical protein